jgi:hypothetical protein
MDQILLFEQVQAYCRTRDIELILAPTEELYSLSMRGMYDGCGNFFTITARGVEFVEIAAGITIGDICWFPNFEEMCQFCPKWSHLVGEHQGNCLLILDDYGESWEKAQSRHLFVVVSEEISFSAGIDWLWWQEFLLSFRTTS